MKTQIDPYSVMDSSTDYFLSPSKHESIKNNVLRFIESNPMIKIEDVITKFDLHLSFVNAKWSDVDDQLGIGIFNLYTTDTQCGIKINMLPIRLPIKKQWPQISSDHPANWIVVRY